MDLKKLSPFLELHLEKIHIQREEALDEISPDLTKTYQKYLNQAPILQENISRFISLYLHSLCSSICFFEFKISINKQEYFHFGLNLLQRGESKANLTGHGFLEHFQYTEKLFLQHIQADAILPRKLVPDVLPLWEREIIPIIKYYFHFINLFPLYDGVVVHQLSYMEYSLNTSLSEIMKNDTSAGILHIHISSFNDAMESMGEYSTNRFFHQLRKEIRDLLEVKALIFTLNTNSLIVVLAGKRLQWSVDRLENANFIISDILVQYKVHSASVYSIPVQMTKLFRLLHL